MNKASSSNFKPHPKKSAPLPIDKFPPPWIEELGLLSDENNSDEAVAAVGRAFEAVTLKNDRPVKLSSLAVKNKSAKTGKSTGQANKFPEKTKAKAADQKIVKKPRESVFREHVASSIVEDRIKIFSGSFRINPKNRRIGYVTTETLAEDIFVIGHEDQNRSFHGDKVLVEVLGELEHSKTRGITTSGSAVLAKLRVSSSSNAAGDGALLVVTESVNSTAIASFLEETSASPDTALLDADEDEEEEVERIVKVGRVLRIVERREFVDLAGYLTMRNDDTTRQNIFFQPMDARFPLFLVKKDDCKTSSSVSASPTDEFQKEIFVVRYHRWPANSRFPFGTFRKSLGFSGDLEVETRVIIETNHVPDQEFSSATMKQLSAIQLKIDAEECSNRRDFRNECVFTIDPETARDLDDALSCKQLTDGNFEVSVHIADVSHFITENSSLDKEALSRATSTYLVQKCVPMLPSLLCENLCSLNPGVDRLAFSVTWIMNSNAEIISHSFSKSIIRSCVKMSYQEAQKLIDGSQWESVIKRDLASGQAKETVTKSLMNLHRLGMIMRKRRFDGGSLKIDQPKLYFRLDESQYPLSCHIYEIKESNNLVEEFMLLANITVAEKISSTFPKASLLRLHPPPLPRTLDSFLKYCQKMGISIDASSSKAFQASINAIEDKRTSKLLQILAIRPMQRASYFSTLSYEDMNQWRHYALNVPKYTHFTSPIRRYADLVVHRTLFKCLTTNGTNYDADDQIARFAKQCNLKKEDAREAQDASMHVYLCIFLRRLEQKLGKLIYTNAVLLDMNENGIEVLIEDFALEKRVFFDRCNLKSVTLKAQRELQIYWPQQVNNPLLPYGERAKELQRQTKGDVMEILFKSDDPKPIHTVKIMDTIPVVVKVTRASPMDLEAYLIDPDLLSDSSKFAPFQHEADFSSDNEFLDD